MECECENVKGMTHREAFESLHGSIKEAVASIDGGAKAEEALPPIIMKIVALGCPVARAFLLFAPFIPQLAPYVALIAQVVNQACPAPAPAPTPA